LFCLIGLVILRVPYRTVFRLEMSRLWNTLKSTLSGKHTLVVSLSLGKGVLDIFVMGFYSVVDPRWVSVWIRFLSQCRSGSRELNQSGSGFRPRLDFKVTKS
jgi:hypothetical protein